MRWRRWLGLPLGALLCAQCAMPESRLPQLPAEEVNAEQHKQQIAHLREYFGQLHRVDNVAFRIRTANAADCGENVAGQIGLHALTPQSLPRRYRSYSREALDITWARPTVVSVSDGSPAALAGIVKGDEITALNGELIPVTGTANWMRKWFARNGIKPVRAAIRRNGNDRIVTVTPVMGCAIPIHYVAREDSNAYTDGERIVIHSGTVELCTTDAQLASIIGHELAHANLGHLRKRTINMLIGTASGIAVDGTFALGGISTNGAFTREFMKAGAAAFSVNFEREADYVGAYYIARAGYDLAGVEDVWRAMAMKTPAMIRFTTTHPTSPMRFVQMQKVASEIAAKKARAAPLMPELRIAQAEQATGTMGDTDR